jgi:hypothetical protein
VSTFETISFNTSQNKEKVGLNFEIDLQPYQQNDDCPNKTNGDSTF